MPKALRATIALRGWVGCDEGVSLSPQGVGTREGALLHFVVFYALLNKI